MKKYLLPTIYLSLLFILNTSCSQQTNQENVVVYTAVDQVYSEKILRGFEEETGITVKAVYDAEASKAVGLEQRLLSEKESPKADLFWNSEFMRTARLAQNEVFAEFAPDSGTIPDVRYLSPDKLWFGMGARSRVFIVNTKEVSPQQYPKSLLDLIDPKFKGKIAISSPFSGSTSTHFAALYLKYGEKKFIQFLEGLKANEVALLAGNSVVKDNVGYGRYAFGLVDTDDALVGIEQGLPVEMVYYDQEGSGVFSFFQTISVVKMGPNPANAARLFNYLLTEEIEKELIRLKAVQFPLLSSHPDDAMPVMWTARPDEVVDALKPSIDLIRKYLD